MIITLNGEHGSGKSTVGKRIAQELGMKYVCTGEIFRSMAQERNMTLVELLELGEKDKSIDQEIDQRTIEIGRSGEEVVFDSRLAWCLIPNSLKVFLKASEEVAARRILIELEEKSENRKNENASMGSIEEIIEANRRRKKTDNKRYKEYYGVYIWDESNYDLVVDTTSLSKDEVFEKIRDFIEKSRNPTT